MRHETKRDSKTMRRRLATCRGSYSRGQGIPQGVTSETGKISPGLVFAPGRAPSFNGLTVMLLLPLLIRKSSISAVHLLTLAYHPGEADPADQC